MLFCSVYVYVYTYLLVFYIASFNHFYPLFLYKLEKYIPLPVRQIKALMHIDHHLYELIIHNNNMTLSYYTDSPCMGIELQSLLLFAVTILLYRRQPCNKYCIRGTPAICEERSLILI